MGARARAGMVAGAAFAVLLFVGTMLMFGNTPDTANKSADDVTKLWAGFLQVGKNRTGVIIGAYLLVLAAIALVWFASALRDRYTLAGAPTLSFALLAAVGVAAATVGPLALTGGHAFGDDPVPTDGNVIWLTFSLVFPGLLFIFAIACAAFIASVLVGSRGVMPMWLWVFGWIAVVAALLGVLFVPMILVMLWFLVAGIYEAVVTKAPATAAAATP